MRAMILAAGLGTRLKPLTDTLPKALVVVHGRTLLEHALLHLQGAGIREVIINVHHFAGQVISFLEKNNNFGMQVTISDEKENLLETGGGVSKAAWFLQEGEGALVRNVDILSDIDLREMISFHQRKKGIATLAVRERETSRYFLFNKQMELSGWENRKTRERIVTRGGEDIMSLAFSGIQVLSPGFFPLITETGSFSLTSLYLRLSKDHDIYGFRDESKVWLDAGKEIPVAENF